MPEATKLSTIHGVTVAMIRRQTCPICEKELPVDDDDHYRLFPFCSERCRRIDFFRWSDGRYAIVEPLSPEVVELLDPENPVHESY